MKLTNIVFCLTLLAGAATSCIREDLDDCLSTNKLLLSYKGDGTTEIFPDKICRVEMFVFDAEIDASIRVSYQRNKLRAARLRFPRSLTVITGLSAWGTLTTRRSMASPRATTTGCSLPPGIISTRNRLPAMIRFIMPPPPIPCCRTAPQGGGPDQNHRVRQLSLRSVGGSGRSSRHGKPRRLDACA